MHTEATRSSFKTSAATYKTTWCNKPADHNLNNQRCENLKSYDLVPASGHCTLS